MAIKLDDIVASIKGDTSDITAKFDDLKKRVDDLGGTINKTSSTISDLIKPAAITGLGYALTKGLTEPMLGFASSAIKAADQIEQAKIAFTTMLKSGEKAQRMLDDMEAFAASTPFEFPELLESGKRLLAMGFTAEQVIPTLNNVGNAVAGIGGNAGLLNRVILALGQMQTKGRLQAQEMKQLTEAGINAWDMLATHLKVTVAEAMDMVTKKQVSGAEAVLVIQRGMAEQFGGMMNQQSKTITGIMSNLNDTIGFLMRDIGTEIVKAFNLKDVATSVQEFANSVRIWFRDLSDGTKRLIIIMVGAFALGGPILVAVGAFMAAMSVITAPMMATGAIIVGVIAGAAAIAASWTELKEKSTILATVFMALTNAIAFIKDVLEALHEAAEKLMVRMGAMIAVVELLGKQLFSSTALSKEAWKETLNQVEAIDKWAAAEIKAIETGKNSTHVKLEAVKAVEKQTEVNRTFALSEKQNAEMVAESQQKIKEAAMERMAAEMEIGLRQDAHAKEVSKQVFADIFAQEERDYKDRYSGSDTMRVNSETNRNALMRSQADIQAGIEARKRADEDYRIDTMTGEEEVFNKRVEMQLKFEQFSKEAAAMQKARRDEMKFGWGDVFGEMSQSAQFAFGSIRSTFANTIADMAEGTANWRDFWKASQRAVITSTANWAIEVVGKFIAKNAAIMASEAATSGFVITLWSSTSAAVMGAFAAMTAGIQGFFLGTIIPTFAAVGEAVMSFLAALATSLDISIFGAPFSIPVWAAVGLVAAAVGVISAFAFGAFAEGGIVKGPMMGLVGEAGPEAIIPLDQLGSIMGGGATTVVVELDGRVIAKSVFDNMPSVMRVRGMSA